MPPHQIPVKPSDPTVALLHDVIREQQQFFKEVLVMVGDIAKVAIAPPYQGPSYQETVREASGAPIMEMLTDSAIDPMEVFLGPEFLREESGMYDEGSDAPFGLPGIKAVQ